MNELSTIKNFFEDKQNKINISFQKEKYYHQLNEITATTISATDKKMFTEWLTFYLTMNFSNIRFQYMEELIDQNYLQKKINLIRSGTYHDKIIDILCKCAIAETFEKYLEFNENAFFMKTDLLKQELTSIINHEI